MIKYYKCITIPNLKNNHKLKVLFKDINNN